MSDTSGAGSTPGPTPSGPGGWTPPTAAELQRLLPQYEVEAMIGQGGMGAVYRGRQVSLRRKVAIKVLPETLAANADQDSHAYVERFRLEARAMARLDHPAILSVYDFGQTEAGHLFFVMEYVDGMDIQQYIQASGGEVAAEHAIAIVSHVLDALEYAHAEGIIHRDIKPANVLINREGRVKIADFGLAKQQREGAELAAMSGLTRADVAMGTPDYIAPEAFDDGVVVDRRADLYAVGVMLYRMLTGSMPRGMFQLPSEKKPELDERFDAIIAQALESDPDRRYQDAGEFRGRLGELLTAPVSKVEAGQMSGEVRPPVAREDLPTEVRELGDSESEAGRRRRHRWRVGGGLAAAAVLVAALGLLVNRPQPAELAGDDGGGGLEGEGTAAVSQGAQVEPLPPTPPWPPDTQYRVRGRFRSWSSQPGDPVMDLRRLRGIDDVHQVHVRGGGWIVLRDSGETISSNDRTNLTGIRRICPGRHDHFALITAGGGLIALDGRGEVISDGGPPDDLGPVIDAYVAYSYGAALLEDGSLRVWGRDFDGIADPGNREWKEKPELPPGARAVAMASTDISLAVRLDDGRMLAWTQMDGAIDVPAAFAAEREGDFSMNIDYLLAVPGADGRALSWHYRQPEKPAGFSPVEEPAIALRDASLDTLLFGVDRQPRVGGQLLDALPEIDEVLARVRCSNPDLLSLHFAREGEERTPIVRLLWFDEHAARPVESGAPDVETTTVDGERFFTWRSDYYELQLLENSLPAAAMEEFLSALDQIHDQWIATTGLDPARRLGGRLVLRDFRGKTPDFHQLDSVRRATGVVPVDHLAEHARNYELSGEIPLSLAKVPWMFDAGEEFGARAVRPLGREHEHWAVGEQVGIHVLDAVGIKGTGTWKTLDHHRENCLGHLRRWRDDAEQRSWSQLVEKRDLDLAGEVTSHGQVFRGLLFELCGIHGEDLLRRWLLHELPRLPMAPSNQVADDQMVISLSLAVGEDLTERFERDLRWPVSDAAKAEIDRRLTARPWLQTRYAAVPVEPEPVEGKPDLQAWTGRHFRLEPSGTDWTPQMMGELLAIKDASHEYCEWLCGMSLQPEGGGIQTVRENDKLKPGGYHPMRSSGLGQRSPGEFLATLREFQSDATVRTWLATSGRALFRARYESLVNMPEAERVPGRLIADGLQVAMDAVTLDRTHVPLKADESAGRYWRASFRALRRYEREFAGDWPALVRADAKEWQSVDVASAMILELYRRFGDAFLRRLVGQEIPRLDPPQRDVDSIDGFFVACCRASRSDLSEEFIGRWRWPVSEEVRRQIEAVFSPMRIDGLTDEASWQNFLPSLADRQLSARRGTWQLEGDGLVVEQADQGGSTLLGVATEPLAAYDLRVRLTRRQPGGIAFLLPTARGGVSLTQINSADAVIPESHFNVPWDDSPHRRVFDGDTVTIGQSQEWLIEMRPDRLKLTLDGDPVGEWTDLDWQQFRQAGAQSLRYRQLFGLTALGRRPGEVEIEEFSVRVHSSSVDSGLATLTEVETDVPIEVPSLTELTSRVANFQRARLLRVEALAEAYRVHLERQRDAVRATNEVLAEADFDQALAGLGRWLGATREALAATGLAPVEAEPIIAVPHAALDLHRRFGEELRQADSDLLLSFGASLDAWSVRLGEAANGDALQVLNRYRDALRDGGVLPLPTPPWTAVEPTESTGPQSTGATDDATSTPTGSRWRGRLVGHATAGADLDLSLADGIDDFIQIHLTTSGWVGLRESGQTLCADMEDRRQDVVRIVPGPGDAYGLIDREGNLEIIDGASLQPPPRQIENVADAVLATGASLATDRDGDLMWWGNSYDSSWQRPPGAARRDVIAIAAGSTGAWAVTEGGRLYHWNYDDERVDRDFRQGVQAIAVGDPIYGGATIAMIHEGQPGYTPDPRRVAFARSASQATWVKGAGSKTYLFGRRGAGVEAAMDDVGSFPEVTSLLSDLVDWPQEGVSMLAQPGTGTGTGTSRDIRLVWIEPAKGDGD